MAVRKANELEVLLGKPLRQILYDLYWLGQQSLSDVAKILGVSETTVRRWMVRYSIPRRGAMAAQQLLASSGKKPYTGRPGDANPNWKGGRVAHGKGYILAYAPWHPCQVDGYVMEHRLVAEQVLGRYLEDGEVVHHIDGDRANNIPGNLAVLSTAEHTRLHNQIRKARAVVSSERTEAPAYVA